MDILNETPFAHSLAIGLGPDRQARLGVVLKATFRIPERLDAPVEVAAEQLPVDGGDEYHRGDVTGSVRTEADVFVFKPRADIVLVGTAYAPGGRPATDVTVGLRVGKTQQVLRVSGDRRWVFPTALAVVPLISRPEPFVAMPLVYERAFGGFDHKGKAWCPKNHIGRGFVGAKTRESMDGRLLPNIEDPERQISSWDDTPDPVGFGFYGKSWEPRGALTGVDIDNLDPDFGLASDFDHGFFNGAHPALQVPGYLTGDEAVDLLNVTPGGRCRFTLPGLRPRMAIHVYTAAGDDPDRETRIVDLAPVLDTLVFFPDEGVFTLVWRGSTPVQRDLETVLMHVAKVVIEAETSDSAETERLGAA